MKDLERRLEKLEEFPASRLPGESSEEFMRRLRAALANTIPGERDRQRQAWLQAMTDDELDAWIKEHRASARAAANGDEGDLRALAELETRYAEMRVPA